MALMHVFLDPDGRLAVVVPKPAPHPSDDGPMFAGISPVGSAEGYEGFEIDLDPELLVEPESADTALEAGDRRSPVDYIEQLVREQRDVLPRAYFVSAEGPGGRPGV
jgi:hypothetical protein